MERILYAWLSPEEGGLDTWLARASIGAPGSPFMELLSREKFDTAVLFRPPGFEGMDVELDKLRGLYPAWGSVQFVAWPVDQAAADGHFEQVMLAVSECFDHYSVHYPHADHQVVWATEFAPAQVCFFLLERARHRDFRLIRVMVTNQRSEIIADFEERVPFYVLPRPSVRVQTAATLRAFSTVSQESRLMQALVAQARRWAVFSDPILLTGPTGVGKTLFARAIHASGPRASKPFVSVNCAAIPRDLLESELFGHTKGAFTGAVGAKKGFLEVAHQGTLFLDEIAELSPDHQTKLLKALQEKTFRPVGSMADVYSDFRLITATNRPLLDLVDRSVFREDLYFRIAVGILDIPGLADRPEEILPLAQEFLKVGWQLKLQELHKAEFDLESLPPEKHFDSSAELWLRTYSWPGNIREMENLVSRVLVFTDVRPEVTAADLEGLTGSPRKSGSSGAWFSVRRQPSLKDMKDDLERQALAWALEQTRGNRAEASRLLGMDASWASKKEGEVRTSTD